MARDVYLDRIEEAADALELGELVPEEAAEYPPEEEEPDSESEDETEVDTPAGLAPPEDECPLCHGEGVVPLELATAPDYETCVDCNGLGVVATGSLNPQFVTADCLACYGKGFRQGLRADPTLPAPPQREWDAPGGYRDPVFEPQPAVDPGAVSPRPY